MSPPGLLVELNLVIDCGLSLLNLFLSSLNIQGAFNQVASPKFIVSFFSRRCRFGSCFNRAVGFLIPWS